MNTIVGSTALPYVGAAYAAFFVLIFLYAWRLTAATRRLAERVDELEREKPSR
ncbi:MAG TPA: CcmD family protein [Candidatus Binatia bacterium]|nr:CcmD family protein [Candidatus Binatia bacterium]